MRDARLLLIMAVLVLTASMTMAGTLTVHGPRFASLCTEDAVTGCVVSLPVAGTTCFLFCFTG